MTKTAVIWDMCGESPIKFFVAPGDLRHLNGCYINHLELEEQLNDELMRLVYDDNGQEVVEMLDSFPVDAVMEGAFVIVAGFVS